MSEPSNKRGYFCVEGRWEKTRERPEFFVIDEIGGSLDDAQRTAKSYLDRHVAANGQQLAWVRGVLKGHDCWYASTDIITFRISC